MLVDRELDVNAHLHHDLVHAHLLLELGHLVLILSPLLLEQMVKLDQKLLHLVNLWEVASHLLETVHRKLHVLGWCQLIIQNVTVVLAEPEWKAWLLETQI